ncbi:MAG TPA: hypothetical protein VFQ39_04860 [Longimicrobium sp.]|nr:hypothetical protein [Longimicrobium sp.]
MSSSRRIEAAQGTATAPVFAPAPGPLGMPRAGWAALGGICVAGAAVGAALAVDWRSAGITHLALVAAGLAMFASGLVRWVRGGRKYARSRVVEGIEQWGGGGYGTVAFATWLFLELLTLQRDWASADGVAGFVERNALQWLLGFSGDTIKNAVWAGMWPVYWFTRHGLVPVLVAGGLAWAVNAVAERWPVPPAAARAEE